MSPSKLLEASVVRETTADSSTQGRSTAQPRSRHRSSRSHLDLVLPATAAAMISQTWFRPGSFIAQGDIPPFIQTALDGEYAWAWGHNLTAAGSPSFEIVRGVEALLVRTVGLIGGSEILAQRVFYAGLLASVALGAGMFARCFTSRAAVVGMAALFACVNPFILTYVPNPVFLCALAIMGISGSMIVQAGRGHPVSPVAFAFSTLGLSYLLVNVPTLLVSVGWLLGLVALGSTLAGPGGSRRSAELVWRALPWTVLLNIWWLVPGLITFLGHGAVEVAVDQDVRVWAWTHARASIANVLSLNAGWAWDYPENFPFAATLDAAHWNWLRFVPPLLGLSAPLLSRGVRRRTAFAFVAVLLGLVLIGKGLHPPIPELNLWLYDHLPGFWLLREPFSKVGPPLVLVYVALLTLSVDAILDKVGERKSQGRGPVVALTFAACGVGLLAYPYPLWNGELFPESKVNLPSAHVRVPDSWRAVAGHVNEDRTQGKALVLPLADFYQMPTNWGYYGADVIPKTLFRRPTIQPVPETYFSDQDGYSKRVQSIETLLLQGSTDSIPALLHELGVSHVVLRRDLDLSFPNRSFADPQLLADSLGDVPSLARPQRFAVASVYSVTGDSGEVHLRDDSGRPVQRPSLTWNRRNPARYSITVAGMNRPVTLVLTESYDPGWRLSGLPSGAAVTHQRIDGYANGWRIDAEGTFTLVAEYRPARLARAAILISLVTALLAVGLPFYHAGRITVNRTRLASRRRARTREADESS